MLKKVEGIIIRSIDYGETNKIVTIFSKQAGKIGMMARGAKKTNSRLSSVSQLFTYGHFLYYSSSGLGTMTQGEVVDSFRSIREDLFKTAYAAYIVELTDKLTDEKNKDIHLFELLYHSLFYLNKGLDMEVITFIFATKMLAVAGIAPQLNHCVNCERTKSLFDFSVREGGFLCEFCSSLDPHRIPLSEPSGKLLPLFYNIDITRLGTISLKAATKREIKTVLEQYYEAYSGVYLKSKRFLNQLDRLK